MPPSGNPFEEAPHTFQVPRNRTDPELGVVLAMLWSSVREARRGDIARSNETRARAAAKAKANNLHDDAIYGRALQERDSLVTPFLSVSPIEQEALDRARAALEAKQIEQAEAGSTPEAWAAEERDREETEWAKEGDTTSYGLSWLPGGHAVAKGKRAGEAGLKALFTPKRLIIGGLVVGALGAGALAIRSYAAAKARG